MYVAQQYKNQALPTGWVSARLMPQAKISDPKKIAEEVSITTPGKISAKIKFVE